MSNLKANDIRIARFETDEPEVLESDLQNGKISSFHYDNDWLFMMPVVEKIETLKTSPHHSLDVIISKDKCIIELYFDGHSEPELHWVGAAKDGEKKIKAVYKAVIKFIAWYNNYLYASGQKELPGEDAGSCEVDPEEKYYKDLATYNERHSDTREDEW